MKRKNHKTELQEDIAKKIDKDMHERLIGLFPELNIITVTRLQQNIFLAGAQNQQYGVRVMKLPHLKYNQLKRYKAQLLSLKHNSILQIKAIQQQKSAKNLIIVIQRYDQRLKERKFNLKNQLIQILKIMNQIVEGCIYLNNNYPYLLQTLQYDEIYLKNGIPKIFNLSFIKKEQEQKLLKQKRTKHIKFRQIMRKLGIIFLSFIHQECIDSSLQYLQLENQVKRIQHHDLKLMLNEMIFNQNQIQTPAFDDILIYLTRIKYKCVKFQHIEMDIQQIYTYYQQSSVYLTSFQLVKLLNSYQKTIQSSALLQNSLAQFLLAKMLKTREKFDQLSYSQRQKIQKLFTSAYKKGQKYSAFQLYKLQSYAHETEQHDDIKRAYLDQAIKRQDPKSYVQIQWLRYKGYLDIKREPQKALYNLQKVKNGNLYLFINLANLCLKNGKYQKGEKYISKCFAYGKNDILEILSVYWQKQKKYSKSIEYQKKYIQYLYQNQRNYDDKLGEVQFYIGQNYRQENKYQQAKKWYEKCFSKPNKYKLSALIQRSIIDEENQLSYLNRAIQLNNDGSNNLPIAYNNLALYYTRLNRLNHEDKQNNLKKAIQYLQMAQNLDYIKSSIKKGKLISKQNQAIRNENLSIQILYEAYKCCDEQFKQSAFKNIIENDGS